MLTPTSWRFRGKEQSKYIIIVTQCLHLLSWGELRHQCRFDIRPSSLVACTVTSNIIFGHLCSQFRNSVVWFVIQNHRAIQMLQSGLAMLKLCHVHIQHSVSVYSLLLNLDLLRLDFYSCGICKKMWAYETACRVHTYILVFWVMAQCSLIGENILPPSSG
jgi:hypothetical protein